MKADEFLTERPDLLPVFPGHGPADLVEADGRDGHPDLGPKGAVREALEDVLVGGDRFRVILVGEVEPGHDEERLRGLFVLRVRLHEGEKLLPRLVPQILDFRESEAGQVGRLRPLLARGEVLGHSPQNRQPPSEALDVARTPVFIHVKMRRGGEPFRGPF